MRITRWGGLAVAGATMAAMSAMSVVPLTTAHAAAQTLSVQVGGDSVVNGTAFEGMRFLSPGTLIVNKGDTIAFTFAGFHTATLLPANVGADDWVADNATGLGSPYGLVQVDSDDTGMFQVNPKVAFPSDPTCGTTTTPCTYDGTSVVNSGLSVLMPPTQTSWSVTINGKPGDTFWVICLVHPHMAMRVKIAQGTDTPTTQAAIDSYKNAQLAADHESAAALLPKLNKPTRHKTAGGATVWDAYAGFDQDGFGLDGMFPHSLHIKKGQTVRWHFTQLMGNIHTVTFPRSKVGALNAAFPNPVCENASGDTPPNAAPPQFCSTGPQDLELELAGSSVLPSGGHTYAGGTGILNSGVEGANAPNNSPFDVKFTKASSKKGYSYACIVHGTMMTGTIYVTST